MKKTIKLKFWQRICLFILWPLITAAIGLFLTAAFLSVMAVIALAWPFVLCKGSWSK